MSDATLRALFAHARRLKDAGTPFVLATIISTEGSTYRKAGASMIIDGGGGTLGMLAGGSFEEELAERAQPVLETGQAIVFDFEMPSPRDTDTGRTWRRDGMARILLQRFDAGNGYQPLADLMRAVAQSRSAVMASVVDSDDAALAAGRSFLCDADATPGLSPLAPELAQEIRATAAAALDTGTPLLVRQHTGAGEAGIFFLPVHPPLHLLILGAVPDSVPVSRLARLLGWRNTIADPRSAYCRGDRFPDADAVLNVDPDNLEAVLNLDKVDAALLLTRSFDQDKLLLPTLARTSIPFVGILGSRSRCARLMETLGPDGILLQDRVHGPVGLDMHCDTPEEIALSIVAQIQSLHRPGRRPVPEIRALAAPRPAAGPAAETAATPASLPPLLWAVVLAAGGSTRFGGFKQMIEWEGESLLRRAVRIATAMCGERVVVVHGPKPTKCQRELGGFNVRHVINEHWESGMALSLKTGLRALPEDCTGALVLLCDQPLLRPERVLRLAQVWQRQPERIVASAYAGTRGVPAIFPRRLFGDLRKLTGDRGARSLLEAHAADVVDVDLPEAAVDIDTQDDYASLITHGGRTT